MNTTTQPHPDLAVFRCLACGTQVGRFERVAHWQRKHQKPGMRLFGRVEIFAQFQEARG